MQPTQPHEYLEPSKSEVKRQMLALQELGRKLSDLNPKQLASLNLDADLLAAIEEGHRIKSHEAKRRHMQRLGKLLRHRDSEAIQTAMDVYDSSTQAHSQHFKKLEYWRDQLISLDNANAAKTLAEFIEIYPDCDVQHLRQLIRNSRQELEAAKPPANARKLFRYIRQLADS